MLEGIRNFLEIINANWTTIIVIVGLLFGLYNKIVSYARTSNDEKIEIAKKQIQQTILGFITDAEIDFSEWDKAGSVKRSSVIKTIYEQYPVLSHVVNQDELTTWIDEQIDNSLVELRKVIEG